VVALAPDLVITLDDRAASVVPAWLGDDRHTVVVEATRDPDLGIELVSWRLGPHRGPHPARRGAPHPATPGARTINRLCSGPQPLPPDPSPPASVAAEDWRDGVASLVTNIRPARRPLRRRFGTADTLVLDGAAATTGSIRLEAFTDQLVRAGLSVHRRRTIPTTADLVEPATLILGRREPSDALLAAIAGRRQAGRPTIVDLTPDDLVPGADARGPRLAPEVVDLVQACGLATVPTRVLAGAVHDDAVAVVVVPTLLSERTEVALAAELESDAPVVGWQLDAAPGDEVDAVASALASLLAAHPDVTVEAAGSHVDVAIARAVARIAPAHRTRVMTRLGRPGADWRRSLRAQVWTADPATVALGGDVAAVAEAGRAGVPTLVAGDNPATRMAAHPRSLVVDAATTPAAWSERLGPLVASPALRAERSDEVAAVAEALFGPEASMLALNRFLGWVQRQRDGA
jgi:hypothetical protein